MEQELENIKKNMGLFKNLYEYVKQCLHIKEDPEIVFLINKENSSNPIGKTGYYSPEEKKISIYILGRHLKDIMKTMAHEMVHHAQNERGDLINLPTMENDYAQSEPHLRSMEEEAYLIGSMMVRDWEDQIKGQKSIEPNGNQGEKNEY